MAQTPNPVVTGDAVVLDIQIAQLPVRTLAALIDLIVVGVGYLIAVVLWAAALPRYNEAFTAAVMVIFTVAVFVGYPVAMETSTRGRSLGKMAMGLRVVSDDGGPERFRQAAFRALAGVVEIWMLFGSPAVISSLFSSTGKRMGDMFAGTVVVSERGPKPVPPPPMPPHLEHWAATLELSGLAPQQTEIARQFLSRATDLAPSVRIEMGDHVAREVVSRISPPPPHSAPSELVLAAVLAERHRRALIRLMPTTAVPWPPVVAAGRPPESRRSALADEFAPPG